MDWMRKIKVGRLLIGSVLVTLIPLVFLSYFAISSVIAMGRDAEELQEKAVVTQEISSFMARQKGRRLAIFSLVFYQDKSQIKIAKELSNQGNETLKKLKEQLADDATCSEHVKAIEAKRVEYRKYMDPVIAHYTDKKYAAQLLAKSVPADKAYVDAVTGLQEDVRSDLKGIIEQVDASQAFAIRMTVLSLMFAILFAAAVIVFLQRGIVGQLRKAFSLVADTAQKLASSSQELSANSDAMTQATTQISSAISQVAMGAGDQSKSASDAAGLVEQISNAVVQVATGAQNQATSVNETASGVSQLIDAINRVSESAQNVAEVVDATSTVADRGKSAVEETVTGMQSIKETVLDSASKIQTLGEKSKQIGEIIEVIDDIAEQTNLLALNAAIEAARAGEHGKGFAVVADEVRKLAERSAKATGEIAELIKGIQDETMQAVEAMEKGTHEVENGGELAANAGSAIEEMMGSIMQVISQIAKVSENADQMAAASSQVSRAIDQIASISEENSATAEEVASSTNQLVSAVDSIAAASEEAAASAEEVSASSQEQSASVEEISAQVQSLAAMSDELDKLIATVNI